MNDSICIIMPAYNEERVIKETLLSLIDLNYQVIVIDDGSKDETYSIIRKFPVYSIRHSVNLGAGAAIQTGLNFALGLGARIIITFDADGQHDANDIEGMIQPIIEGKSDVVIGSRFLRKEDTQLVPLSKRILLRGAVIVNGLLTGIWLSDAHNGFVVMNNEAAKKVYFNENRYAYLTEFLLQIRKLKLRYVERPTSIIYSDYSMSKGQSPWNALNILIDFFIGRLFR